MAHHHCVYGLMIRSNRVLPGVPMADGEQHSVDVHFEPLDDPSDHRLPGHPQVRYQTPGAAGVRPNLTVEFEPRSQSHRFLYGDGTSFLIGAGASRITAGWPATLSFEDTLTYFLGPILGFVLRQRGRLVLHGSAIALDGQAVVLAGPEGAGKSTLAARLNDLGCPLVSEDVAALRLGRSGAWVESGYPRVRLWPESVAHLRGHASALPRLTPNWDKRYLAVEAERDFCRSAMPLGAVCLVRSRALEDGHPSIQRIGGARALIELIANSYCNHLLRSAQRRSELRLLGRLAASVPLFALTPHRDFRRLDAACELIVSEVRSRVAASA